MEAEVRRYNQFIEARCRSDERDHIDDTLSLDQTFHASLFDQFPERLMSDALDFHVSIDRRHSVPCQLVIDTAVLLLSGSIEG